MNIRALLIFCVTYAGIALGHVPGLVIDRTGIALLGAICMIVFDVMTTDEAFHSIDIPTILLLYSLMVLSAQFRLSGFYTRTALGITRFLDRPVWFMGIMMLVSATFSAVLANDIVCLAFTPVLCFSLLEAGLNPTPFLLGLAISSNIGSAATIIGNPQNMLIGQVGMLRFGSFFYWCIVPTILSLIAAYVIIVRMFRHDFFGTETGTIPRPAWPEYNPHQTRKGLLITVVLLIMFFTPIPRELTAVTLAGTLLCSRKMGTRSILGLIDWHLITLFCGLFIIIRGIELSGIPDAAMHFLTVRGVDLTNPVSLTIVSTLLSNLVSNVPATMLLLKCFKPLNDVPYYILALSSTFAGNLITIGSIANLITFEQAREFGVRIGFWEHARVGIPVTAASMAVMFVWIWLTGES